jgi:Putative lipoprotein GNA1162-like
MRYQERPFFLQEQGLETHGRKTWFDRLVEFDPGKTRFQVAADYAQDPPRRIAVLPFVDHGSANVVVNKIPLSFRDEKAQAEWAWTYANRLRRALTGYLAQREFTVVNLLTIDTTLADHGIQNWEALQAVPPQELGHWLAADTVVYGEVMHYEAYYAFLLANWQVGIQIRMISTQDGHERFSADGSRYSVDFRPAFTMMDIGINSALTLLQLRDVTLARAEEEISREIILRLPRAEHNVATLIAHARSGRSDRAGEHVVQSAPASFISFDPLAVTQAEDSH